VFIDEHRSVFGVEPICRVLQIAPSTYYAVKAREIAPSAQTLRDGELLAEIRRVYDASGELYGVRKVWWQLQAEGVAVARCTVERLMRRAGLVGVVRGKARRTTIADEAADRPSDLVERDFTATAPNRLWVADFTYVATWSGVVYVAFVIDAFSRRIVGWKADTRMRTSLVLDTLEMALWTREREGLPAGPGLICHNDAGSQGGFNWSSQRLDLGGVDGQAGGVDAGVDGAVGDEVAGASVVASGGPARVLAPDRERADERAGRDRGRGVRGGWQPMVQGRWRDAGCRSTPAQWPLLVVCRARGDRDLEGAGRRGA
jgi:putative transposase